MTKQKKVNLIFGLHNHQPEGNFEGVFEHAAQCSYEPFLNVLERFPEICMTIHTTGILLDWLIEKKPEYISKLKKMVSCGQVEILTGGFHEPILPVIPEVDRQGQIQKLTKRIEEIFDYHPRGAWLAERVWEPQLASSLNRAGVEFVPLDTSHFMNAGIGEDALTGYYVTEEEGRKLFLFPISQKLRYTIPFAPVEETIEFLRGQADIYGKKTFVMADDGEKFGVWPGTYEHIYKEKWLENFFQALMENKSWLCVTSFSKIIDSMAPIDKTYLPPASYAEMLEWSMPVEAQKRIHEVHQRIEDGPDKELFAGLVKGGFWRNFFIRYPESNQMHKKMLHISEYIHGSGISEDEKKEACDYLWKAQCNCGYWHGVFGGLYLNFLRSAIYRNLISAEVIVDRQLHGASSWVSCVEKDLDMDGRNEALLSNAFCNYYFTPSSGGALVEWDIKKTCFNVLDTLARRVEVYHEKVKDASTGNSSDSTDSIHEIVRAKEAGLEKFLHYDWHRKNSFLDHFFPKETTLSQVEKVSYAEQGDFVNQPYQYEIKNISEGEIHLIMRREGSVYQGERRFCVGVEKIISVCQGSKELKASYKVYRLGEEKGRLEMNFGVEFNFAMLTGDAPDRLYRFNGELPSDPRPVAQGEREGIQTASLEDGWQRQKYLLEFSSQACLWYYPVQTVSNSESGFERVYQSSVMLPHWFLTFGEREEWKTEICMKVEEL